MIEITVHHTLFILVVSLTILFSIVLIRINSRIKRLEGLPSIKDFLKHVKKVKKSK